MRTTVHLPEDVLKAAKQHAARTNRTFTQLLRDALTATIERERGVESPRRVVLPTFKGDGVHPGVELNSSTTLNDRMDGVAR